MRPEAPDVRSIWGIDVGLTAHDMSDMGRLAQLAINPQGASREEIYLAVASLYRIQGAGLNERERDLMREILRRLTRDVEMAIRIALAERLADDTTAPHDLILLLVDDAIEVARPLILRSPLLTDETSLRLIAEAERRPSGSRRRHAPHIGEPVTDALAQERCRIRAGRAGAQCHRQDLRSRLRDAGREIARHRRVCRNRWCAAPTCRPRWPRACATGFPTRSRSYIAATTPSRPSAVDARSSEADDGRAKRAAGAAATRRPTAPRS